MNTLHAPIKLSAKEATDEADEADVVEMTKLKLTKLKLHATAEADQAETELTKLKW